MISIKIIFGAFLIFGGFIIPPIAAKYINFTPIKSFSLPKRLTIYFTITVLVAFLVHPIEFIFPESLVPSPPFDDIYMPYMIMGFHIFYFSGSISHYLFSETLFKLFDSRTASYIGIFYLPGIFGLIIGTVQWYFVGIIYEYLTLKRKQNNKIQRSANNRAR